MVKTEHCFKSADRIHSLHVICWEPEDKPVGVIQIVHGMTEFIDRYDRFAEYMTARGFVVIGNDHLGHGKSVNSEEEWGYFVKGGGSDIVVKDLHHLTEITKKHYPDVPYIVLGHSMGSFLARKYGCIYSDDIDELIIMGTGYTDIVTRKGGRIFLALNSMVFGDHHRSTMIDKLMFGNYNKMVEQPVSAYDWLSRDKHVIDEYIKTPACTFKFTDNGFKTIMDTIDYIQNRKNINKIRKELPVLIISGDKDPVGNYTKGVRKVWELFNNSGINDLTLKFIEDARHEYSTKLIMSQPMNIFIPGFMRECFNLKG